MKKFLKSPSLLLAVALLLTACSSDDDNQQAVTPEANDHSVEVCIVFAPKDLGDQGYADRILAGMFQFDQQWRHHYSLRFP